ncbi:MAG: flagellar basal body P-ring formation chaperone FlgA, partial [Bosea sp. (in: a-proteobacteria)]
MTKFLIRSVLAAVIAASLAPAIAAPAKPLRATLAAVQPTLRADITAARDILTLGDLVSGLPVGVASQPAFRAPALGETGTIQASRIVEAVQAQGVDDVTDGGSAQVVV